MMRAPSDIPHEAHFTTLEYSVGRSEPTWRGLPPAWGVLAALAPPSPGRCGPISSANASAVSSFAQNFQHELINAEDMAYAEELGNYVIIPN